jgi:hypothetical protein
MRNSGGGVNRILRGYLRRQKVVAGKPESFVRLYFMYNPDQVQRQYLSWNDSTTLDPANEMGVDSDNAMASVPSLTTLSFTLYFDRQIEVMSIDEHPGVMVDLQTFDVLSGNMVYGDPATGNETIVLPPGMSIPDNTDVGENHSGQLQPTTGNAQTMVTAVFAPSLAVQGVLSGANATFTKFSPRMTPTTMALTLTLLVQFVGKNNNQFVDPAELGGSLANGRLYNPGAEGFVPPNSQEQRNAVTKTGAAEAVAWAEGNLMDGGPGGGGHYNNVNKRDDGPPCNTRSPIFTDCSSFVYRSLHTVGWVGVDQGDPLGLGGSCTMSSPSSGNFLSKIRAGNGTKWRVLYDDEHESVPSVTDSMMRVFRQMRMGDVLVRRPGFTKETGHVAYFYGWSGDVKADNWKSNILLLLQSSGTDKPAVDGNPAYKLGGNKTTTSMDYVWTHYSLIARPEPFGPTTDVSD